MELLGVKDIPQLILKTQAALIDSCFSRQFQFRHQRNCNPYKARGNIKLPDAIIAAFVLYMGMPDIPADKDLTRIEGLDLILLKL